MFELLPARVERVLDLGTGDGITLALVLAARPEATGVGLDFQDEMLRRARERFAGDARVEIGRHDLDEPLPDDLGDVRRRRVELRDPPPRARPPARALRRGVRPAAARAACS